MFKHTTFGEFQQLAKQSRRVVLVKEILGDKLTPTRAFQALSSQYEDVVLLDSADHPTADAACIYLGFDAIAEFNSQQAHHGEEMFSALRKFFQAYKSVAGHHLAKFAGGMIGFLSYDAVRFIETIPDQHSNDDEVPEICFKFYGTHVVFDKRSGKVVIAKVVMVEKDLALAYQQGNEAIEQVIKSLHMPFETELKINQQNGVKLPVVVDASDEVFCEMVSSAKRYIRRGDAFQVVPSRQFTLPYDKDPFDIYRALRIANPAKYQFFIRNKNFSIIGSSPETLARLQNGIVEVNPIAGTRPRGVNAMVDQEIESELRQNTKENAEHMMLVDLGRNDVGAVAVPGSVTVPECASIHKYAKVMHIVSTVQATLRDDYDAFDVLRAVFPAGTLTGAPKIRAMQIIDEIETSRRGVYGGAICAVDNQGQLDSCITIRSVFLKDQVASVRAGAGVVLDSDPQAEADETRHKASAVLEAIQLALGGLL